MQLELQVKQGDMRDSYGATEAFFLDQGELELGQNIQTA